MVPMLHFQSFLLRGSRVRSQVVQQLAARCLLPRGVRTTQVSIRRNSAAKRSACAAQLRNKKTAGLHAADHHESSSAPVGREAKFSSQFNSEYQAREPASADTSTSDKQGVSQTKEPLFRFGVITDVQYADVPYGTSFEGVPRFYRHSLQVLRRAVDAWLQLRLPIQFAVHFGDIVDSIVANGASGERSEKAVRSVLDQFARLPCRTYHMLGNHCLVNFPRVRLNELLDIPGDKDGCSYYSFKPHPDFRFVVLDGYDISMLGWPPDHPNTLVAEAILNKHNPNQNQNSPKNLEGFSRRFLRSGGGVSVAQLIWLRQQLGEAQQMSEKVIVCCHLPLEPASTEYAHLLWNYDLVLDLLGKHACVVATLSGHAHRGGYAKDKHGIHHRVLEAALECPEGRDAYAYVDVFSDRLVLHGTDMMPGMELPFSRDVREFSGEVRRLCS